MKVIPTVIISQFRHSAGRRNLKALSKFILYLTGLIFLFSVVFHYIMDWEGRDYTWVTGFYWTLTVMSTLGFGDITFNSDLGRLFSIVVLLSGTIFMLILLPFTFIQFFYAPWIEAQNAALAPRSLPKSTTGHVILTNYGPVESALVRRLVQYNYSYVILVDEVAEALRLHDLDLQVMVGYLDDPETYTNAVAGKAALVAATHSDVVNTNVVFTVREVAHQTPIIATCSDEGSVDNLQLAGCNAVLQLSDLLGKAMARRAIGRDAKTHVIGRFNELLIAEASAAGTPLVGRSLRDIQLPSYVNVNVVGVWQRGQFFSSGPETMITDTTILLLAGTREQFDEYDSLFCIYHASDAPVIILGGGRVGRAMAKSLAEQGVEYVIVEKNPERARNQPHCIVGDASNVALLTTAGLMKTAVVAVTTHDDDMNVYLTLYCRRLRPDIQIISRSTKERNISTLHRAGADFVLSYASMGANAIFNMLKRTNILLLAEGLDVFTVDMPALLAGRTLGETAIRKTTQCNVVAIDGPAGLVVNPDPATVLDPGAKLMIIGDNQSQEKFLDRYVRR